MRDHLSWRTIFSWHKVLHLNGIEPVAKDHLLWKKDHICMTNGLVFQGRSHCTVKTVLRSHCYEITCLEGPDIHCGFSRQVPLYSKTCLEKPLLWETTCLEGPDILGRSYTLMILNLSPKTTCLERPHLYGMANGVVLQDGFHCTLYSLT